MKCFGENIRLFGDPQIDPEKFNLYNGLSNLAEAIERLEIEVQSLQQEVQRLRMRG